MVDVFFYTLDKSLLLMSGEEGVQASAGKVQGDYKGDLECINYQII